MKRTLPCWVLLIIALAASQAGARTEKHLAYPKSMVWNSCVRMLRVDYHLDIVEKDSKAGYILFEYEEAGMSSTASFEFVDDPQEGQPGVKAMLNLVKLPSYLEKRFLEKLEKKLKDEFGPPRPVPPTSRIDGDKDNTSDHASSPGGKDGEDSDDEPDEPEEPEEPED